MANFKIRFSVEKLELEIEGSREDVPIITQALTNQFAGMLSPTNEIVQGKIVEDVVNDENIKPTVATALPSGKGKRKPPKGGKPKPRTTDEASEPLVWTHDTKKWGSPKQNWIAKKKAIWVMYIILQELNIDELTPFQIETAFNENFKKYRTIRATNISRDFNKQSGANAWVGKRNGKWFLTEVGTQEAETLVKEDRGLE